MRTLGDLLVEFRERPRSEALPVLTLTERNGFVPQAERFKKRLATEDTSGYKVVRRHDIAFNPYLLWAGAVAQNTIVDAGVISPLYPTFRVREGHDPRYVARLLLTPQLVSAYDGIAFGSVPRRRRSSVKDFLALPLPALPTLTEQRRIAAILDHADALRAKRREVLAHLDNVIQSRFDRMFKGQASVLWGSVKLEDLGEWKSGGTPPRSMPEHFDGDWPWLSSGELGPLYLASAEESVSASALTQTAVKEIPIGSLLLGMYDTAALKSSITKAPSTCNQAIAFARLDDNLVDTVYAYFAVQAVKARVLASRRGIRQKNLNLSMIRKIEIPRAPLSSQVEFSKFVSVVNAQRAVVGRALAFDHELFASLQARAFRGEL